MSGIELRGVGKTYALYRHGMDRLWELVTRQPRHQSLTALHPVDLSVGPSQVVGIIGKNGSGKSTLLKLTAGTLRPTTGEVSVRGRVSALLELGTGFHPDLTGRENVYISGAIMGLSRETVDRVYEDIVAFSGIGEFMDRPVKTYSSGMFVRLAFAVATCVEPDVLIVDEALSVGDGAFARKSFDRIMAFKEKGATILFCSHSMYQIEAICNRAIWLDQGRIVQDGDAANVVTAYNEHIGGLKRSEPRGPEAEDALPPERAGCEPAEAGWARIESVRVAVDGVAARRLKAWSERSEVSVTVAFASDPAMPPPKVGVAFASREGPIVSSAGTHRDLPHLDRASDGRGEVTVSFPGFGLLKGRYSVDAYLFCENGVHIYDQALMAAELEVDQEGLEQGVAVLPRRWSQRRPEVEANPEPVLSRAGVS